ncbi:hypothetical protein DAPPUDRAFT_331053 [Daphnia pulex]|uniref:Uncharacterized protein n=1 Tax=Daphnia pulex TaxID=6669 RepID=E9HLC9_DAPPU|nr:hypothetical protein DAPPUDRAFT_331053 [Daphnia pulex]|eukprot:EFX67451.1 hypothetical protein DAPPUDRAFT_331053 [Daphnia pulex]
MVEDALFVRAYPLPPKRCSGSFTDYPWEEEEDNGDNDYVQSLCLVDCPDSDLNESNRSEEMSFSEHSENRSFSEGDIKSEYDDTVELEHPLIDDQSLSEGDIEDNIESEYNDTVELEQEIHDDQPDAVEANASFSEEELEDSLLTDGSSDFGDFFVYEHDISADVLMIFPVFASKFVKKDEFPTIGQEIKGIFTKPVSMCGITKSGTV